MLYILLTIIAIGVLLASEAGQALLGWFTMLAVVGGLLYLGFWIVVIAIGLFSNEGIRDTIFSLFTFIGSIFLIGCAIYLINEVYKGFKSGDYKIQKIWQGIKGLVKEKILQGIKNWFIREWKRSKIVTSLFILFLAFTAVMIVWAFLAG